MRKEPVPAKPAYRPEDNEFPKLMYSGTSSRTLQATSAENQKQLEAQGYRTTPPPPLPPPTPSETKEAALARQMEKFDAAWERLQSKHREMTDLYNKSVAELADTKKALTTLQEQHTTLTKAHERVTAELVALKGKKGPVPVASPTAVVSEKTSVNQEKENKE